MNLLVDALHLVGPVLDWLARVETLRMVGRRVAGWLHVSAPHQLIVIEDRRKVDRRVHDWHWDGPERRVAERRVTPARLLLAT
jgi:hypothetical protein